MWHLFDQHRAVSVQDPQPCHELGCLFYRAGDYPTAKVWLQKANQQLPRPLTPGAPITALCELRRGGAPDEHMSRADLMQQTSP